MKKAATQVEYDVPLVDAAISWRESWHRAWTRVLSGEVRAQKRGSRWFLAREDVERVAAANAANRAALPPAAAAV